MGLKEFYYSLEDRYYTFMDGLEQKGWKVYEYFVDPIESHGIPSFPLFSLLSLLVLAGLGFAAYTLLSSLGLSGGGFGGPSTATLNVKVIAAGQPLDGVLVKLSSQEETVRSKTVNGIATFKDVPRGKRLEIKIDQEGYAPASTATLIGQDKSQAFVDIELQPLKPSELSFLVSTQDGAPLPGVIVSSRDSKGQEFQFETDAQGRVTVPYQSKTEVFSVRAFKEGYEEKTITCFANKEICEITLSSTVKPTSVPPGMASIRVEVVDAKGDAVTNVKVVLRHGDTGDPLDQTYTDSTGKAFFQDAVALGTLIYITVEGGEQFESSSTDPQKAGENTEVLIIIKSKKTIGIPPELYKLTLEVVDQAKKPVENAEVRLFLTRQPLRELITATTDSNGKVVFDASPTVEVYATVYAANFLPTRSRVLKGGEAVQIVLSKALLGNHGSLKVKVESEEGAPIELASVTLVSRDGFFLGMPRQETTADGFASFNGVPLETVRAIATFNAQKGESDLVEITPEEKEVTVRLRPAEAFVSVLAKETGTNNLINATFTAYKFSDGSRLDSCTANRISCTLKVPAKTKVFLKVVSAGFVPVSTEEFEVEAGQTFRKQVFLLDASLSAQLRILQANLTDSTGREVAFVDRGKVYQFVISANLPSGVEKGGIYLRVGTKPEVTQEPAVVLDHSKPQVAEIVKGSRYNPGTSCAADLGDQNKELKWVDFSFKEFGSKTVSAKILVSPKATSQDKLVLQYRVYAKKADAFLRVPQDPTFGEKERTDELDSCYAKTFELILPIKEGGSTCNDNACITTLFRTDTSSTPNGLRVPLNSVFNAKIDLRVFTPLDAPFLKLDADKSIEILEYDVGVPTSASGSSVTIPLSFAGETTLGVRFKAALPTQNAKIAFTFGDASGALLEAQRFVVVQGTGVFTVAVDPLQIKANQDNMLVANVKSAEGKVIEDAKLTLKEKAGSPFDGFPSGSETILGDGSEDRGKDGVYRFKSLRPTSVGDVLVSVQRNGFTDAEKMVSVRAEEALEFDRDPSLIELSCQEQNVIVVTNKLNTELKVTGSFSGTACADIRVLGGAVASKKETTPSARTDTIASPSPQPLSKAASTSVTFRIKPSKQVRLIATPVKSESQCVMIFTSETPTGIPASAQDAWFSSACARTATPTPGADTCTARGGTCVPPGQACPTGFVPSTGIQSTTTTGLPVPTAEPPACTEGKTCCLPQTAPSVPPLGQFCPKPDFRNIFGKHLGTYGLNNEPQALAALSAPTVLVMDQRGISTLRVGDRCDNSGSSLTCTKDIYSIIPFNAMAFSIVNRLFTNTDVLVERSSTDCFSVAEVGSQSDILGSIFGGTVLNQIKSFAGLLRNEYRTYVVAFVPRQGCILYDGKSITLTPKSKEGIKLRFETQSFLGGTAAELTFKVEAKTHASDKYAFMVLPSASGDKIAVRGVQGATFEEPAIFVNNIHASKDFTIVVQGTSLANPVSLAPGDAKPATLLIKQGKIDLKVSFSFNGEKAVDWLVPSVDVVTSPTGLTEYDVVGNVNPQSTDCSGASYCTPNNAVKYLEEAQNQLDQLYSDFVASLDTLSYDNNLLTNPNAQQFVHNNAAREYAALCQAYQSCLQQVCSQGVASSTTQAGSPTTSPVPQKPAECSQISGQIPATQSPYAPYGYTQPYGPYGQQPYSAYGPYSQYPSQNPYNPYNPYTTTPYQNQYNPYNPYTATPYGYPSGYGYDPCISAGYNDPYLQQQLQNPYFQNQLYQQPYFQQSFAQYPGLRNDFFNPYYRGLRGGRGFEPILKLPKTSVNIPIKVAGTDGGVGVFAANVDLTHADDRRKWVTIDKIKSGPILPYYVRFGLLGTSASSTKATAENPFFGGFPYLRKRGQENYYKLVNWKTESGTFSSVRSPAAAAPAARAPVTRTERADGGQFGGASTTLKYGPNSGKPDSCPQGYVCKSSAQFICCGENAGESRWDFSGTCGTGSSNYCCRRVGNNIKPVEASC